MQVCWALLMAVYTETAGLVPTEAYHSRATHRLSSFYGSSSAARRQTGPAQPSLQQKLNILSSLSIHEPYLRKKNGQGGGLGFSELVIAFITVMCPKYRMAFGFLFLLQGSCCGGISVLLLTSTAQQKVEKQMC